MFIRMFSLNIIFHSSHSYVLFSLNIILLSLVQVLAFCGLLMELSSCSINLSEPKIFAGRDFLICLVASDG